MRHGHSGHGALAAACLLALLSSGCTLSDPPPPPPTSTPSPTPTENAQEREQRLAYEAAEKSYRDFRAEFNRLLDHGGAKSATPKMTATAGGSYLKENLEVVRAYNGLGYHQEGVDRIVFIRRGGFSETELLLNTCEDASKVRIMNGRTLKGRGDTRILKLQVRFVGTSWKVWSGTGTKVNSCEN